VIFVRRRELLKSGCTLGVPGVAAAVLLLAVAGAAHAQAGETEPVVRHLSLRGDLGYYQDAETHERLDTTALRVDGEYALDERWSLVGRAGLLALGSTPDVGDGDFIVCFGNPAVLLYRRGEWNGMRYRLGAGGAGPLAVASQTDTGRLRRTAYNTAAGMSGLWDLWLWAPSRGAVLLDAQLDVHMIDKTWLLLEAEPALYIPARDLFLDVPLELVLPFAATMGPRYQAFAAGLRVQAVLLPTGEADILQLALGPWLRVAVGCGFLEASYIGNVGEPMAGARGPGIWGVHFGGGGTL
jgi:hypothetical protein